MENEDRIIIQMLIIYQFTKQLFDIDNKKIIGIEISNKKLINYINILNQAYNK